MTKNKQPFYHRVDGLLFTSTTGFDKDEFIKALKKVLKPLGAIPNSIEIEVNGYSEPEPGDPTDLM